MFCRPLKSEREIKVHATEVGLHLKTSLFKKTDYAPTSSLSTFYFAATSINLNLIFGSIR